MGEDVAPLAQSEAPLIHPEEMKANFSLNIGDKISLQGTARTTPAGVISAGIALSAVLLASGYFIRSCRRKSQ